MSRRNAILAMVAILAVLVTSALLTAESRTVGSAARERIVIKICNWDGVVPDKALDGFQMPAGKWADFQQKGWRVEQYLVAPNSPQGNQGFYAVLCK
jgi:hypothetical protein